MGADNAPPARPQSGEESLSGSQDDASIPIDSGSATRARDKRSDKAMDKAVMSDLNRIQNRLDRMEDPDYGARSFDRPVFINGTPDSFDRPIKTTVINPQASPRSQRASQAAVKTTSRKQSEKAPEIFGGENNNKTLGRKLSEKTSDGDAIKTLGRKPSQKNNGPSANASPQAQRKSVAGQAAASTTTSPKTQRKSVAEQQEQAASPTSQRKSVAGDTTVVAQRKSLSDAPRKSIVEPSAATVSRKSVVEAASPKAARNDTKEDQSDTDGNIKPVEAKSPGVNRSKSIDAKELAKSPGANRKSIVAEGAAKSPDVPTPVKTAQSKPIAKHVKADAPFENSLRKTEPAKPARQRQPTIEKKTHPAKANAVSGPVAPPKQKAPPVTSVSPKSNRIAEPKPSESTSSPKSVRAAETQRSPPPIQTSPPKQRAVAEAPPFEIAHNERPKPPVVKLTSNPHDVVSSLQSPTMDADTMPDSMAKMRVYIQKKLDVERSKYQRLMEENRVWIDKVKDLETRGMSIYSVFSSL
jgi:hypothetical protein